MSTSLTLLFFSKQEKTQSTGARREIFDPPPPRFSIRKSQSGRSGDRGLGDRRRDRIPNGHCGVLHCLSHLS